MSSPEKILQIAQSIKSLIQKGNQVIVVVSAMGDTTDELVALSRRITHTPNQREMDMLLTVGERISMSLLSMALNSLGVEAISFTGSQAGVFTDGAHNSARIVDIRPMRIQEELKKGRVVVIAGFQGVNPITKEITTLGRGGSDTTAVALAAHFKADRCDILTDVRGVFSIDPRISNTIPKFIPKIDYNQAIEMTYWGARVLHPRCVELAERTQIPLQVHLSSEEGVGTLITEMEEAHINAVNYISELAGIQFPKELDLEKCLEVLDQGLAKNKMSVPQLIYQRQNEKGCEFFVAAPTELFESLLQGINTWCEDSGLKPASLDKSKGTVTVTGRGLVGSGCVLDAASVLKKNKIPAEAVITTPLSFSFIIPNQDLQKAAQLFHEKFVNHV